DDRHLGQTPPTTLPHQSTGAQKSRQPCSVLRRHADCFREGPLETAFGDAELPTERRDTHGAAARPDSSDEAVTPLLLVPSEPFQQELLHEPRALEGVHGRIDLVFETERILPINKLDRRHLIRELRNGHVKEMI